MWGSSDAASNSVIYAPTSVKLAPTRANANLLYGNTTPDAFITGVASGVFAVDSTEEAVSAGKLAVVRIVTGGSGYTANATVAFSSNNTGSSAAANAFCNTSTGRITLVNVTANGSGYTNNPVATISAPTPITFNALTAVSNTSDTIALTSANSKFLVGDRLTYVANTGNTVVGGLANNTQYYVVQANTTTIQLSLTKTGTALDLTASVTETGHNLIGETATVQPVIGGSKNRGIPHTGWVLRTEGSGGRAGRVQYEVLVAGGITTDGSDDQFIQDA